jgi:hypothetical protein
VLVLYYKTREASPETRLSALAVFPAVPKTEKRMRSGRYRRLSKIIKNALDNCMIITIIIIILRAFLPDFIAFSEFFRIRVVYVFIIRIKNSVV